MTDTYVLILAGGVGSRLSILTEHRAKPAVPFGGKFRIIDFALSNCANSGFFDVGVLTQYRPMSLIDHVGTGRIWDLDRSFGGLEILQPYREQDRGDWYQGTADAVYRNLVQIVQRDVEDVVVLSGDHVYAMDYRPMLRFHRERRFPATVAVTPVPMETASEFGIVERSERGVISGFQEKPERPAGNLASMGIYIFRREVLRRLLTEDAERSDSQHDFGKDIFPRLIQVADVGAYTYEGYWQDIGTVDAFFQANLKLLDPSHRLRLTQPTWPIRTPSADAAAARFLSGSRVDSSLVANGAVISGTVLNSIVFPGVVVEPGATVANAILMNDVVVERGATVTHSILDKRTHIGEGASVGDVGEGAPNRKVPHILSSGISLLGKEVSVARGATVGRNVCLAGGIVVEPNTQLADGSSVLKPTVEV